MVATRSENASDRTTATSSLRRWACWVLVPLFLFTGLELIARRALVASRWYTSIPRIASQGPIDTVLIGSSRVAAAVDPDVFEKAASALMGRPVRAVMPARGYTNLIIHTLGLKQLFARYPVAFKGCTVLLELPGGLPPLRRMWETGLTGWRGTWTKPDHAPQLLLHVLGWNDLPSFWRSQTDLNLKIELSARMMGRSSVLIAHREAIRHQVLNLARRWIRSNINDRLWPARENITTPVADLAQRGGIRRDRASIKAARKRNQRVATDMLHKQHAWRNWNGTALAALLELVKQYGAELVMYDIPQPSMFTAAYETDLRREDRKVFRQWAKRHGIMILRPTFDYDDDDFPDLLHLSNSKAAAFSKALAESWIEGRGQ